MHFVRKAALVVVVPLFSLFLFSLATDVSFVRIVTHPGKIKQIINDSGAYNSVVSGLLDQAKTVSSSDGGSVQLSDPIVRAAADKSITPTYIRQNTETFIDSIYRWLDGKSATPDFLIDLTTVKTQFADNVATSLQPQLAALPVCPAGTNVTSFDAFSATCLPRGVTAQQAASKVKDDILGGKGFLDNPTLTAKDVKSSNNNQSVFNDKLKDAPRVYQDVKKSPIIMALLVLVAGIGIIFLSATKRLGLRKVGTSLLVIGVIMLLFAWGLNHFTDKGLDKINLNNAVLEEKVKIVARDIIQEVDKTYWIIGGAYLVVGGFSLASAAFLFKGGRGSKGHGPKTPEPPVSSNPLLREDTAASKPPAKKRILVQ